MKNEYRMGHPGWQPDFLFSKKIFYMTSIVFLKYINSIKTQKRYESKILILNYRSFTFQKRLTKMNHYVYQDAEAWYPKKSILSSLTTKWTEINCTTLDFSIGGSWWHCALKLGPGQLIFYTHAQKRYRLDCKRRPAVHLSHDGQTFALVLPNGDGRSSIQTDHRERDCSRCSIRERKRKKGRVVKGRRNKSVSEGEGGFKNIKITLATTPTKPLNWQNDERNWIKAPKKNYCKVLFWGYS